MYGCSARGPCLCSVYALFTCRICGDTGEGKCFRKFSNKTKTRTHGVNRRYKRQCLKRARKSTHTHTHTHYTQAIYGALAHRYTIYAQLTVVRVVRYIYTREYLLRDVQKSVRVRTLLCKRPFACNPPGLDSRRRRLCGPCRLINRIVYYKYIYRIEWMR